MVKVIRLATLTVCASLFSFHAIAQADPKWPPLNANEARKEVPVNIGGTLFFSGRYVYEVPRYDVDSFQRTNSYRQDSFEWWAQVPIGDPRGIDARIQRQPEGITGSLPALPVLPPVKKLPPAAPVKDTVPALPRVSPSPPQAVAPIGKLPPLAAPADSKLPNLPSLPPLR